MMFFTKTQIVSRSINPVGMDRLGVYTKTLPVRFHLILKVLALVEVVPAGFVHKRISIHQADGQFGTKLGIASGLAPFDRTHMRLTDTDNAIIDFVTSMIVHPLLLPV